MDLDHVIGEDGELSPGAAEVVGKLNTHTEVSPSGNGMHSFVFAPDANITRHRKQDGFVEIYSEGKYFTVTGNMIDRANNIETRTAELQVVHDKFLLPEQTRQTVTHAPVAIPSAEQDKFLRTGQRDKVFAGLWAGARNHCNESADDQSLMNKLAY